MGQDAGLGVLSHSTARSALTRRLEMVPRRPEQLEQNPGARRGPGCAAAPARARCRPV